MSKEVEKKLKESEDKLQADCFTWFHNTYPHLRGLLWHCPNELSGHVNIVTANKMKAMGLVAGVPDLEFHYNLRTTFIELKNQQGTGRLSKVQKVIHEVLSGQRFVVYVLNSLEQFMFLIKDILADNSAQFTFGVTKVDFYYKHKIFDYLYSLSDCEVVLVENITEEDTRSKFVNFVSEFMVEGYDKLDGFELLFTPDYKGFYKRVNGSDKKIEYNG
ncbi:hypothetical protein KAU11_08990 [Candidatus Babeliales bacterium]|nr:hypothetical protein [Candidatus Babeliales bacterium]